MVFSPFEALGRADKHTWMVFTLSALFFVDPDMDILIDVEFVHR
jgi:hypothetical protein